MGSHTTSLTLYLQQRPTLVFHPVQGLCRFGVPGLRASTPRQSGSTRPSQLADLVTRDGGSYPMVRVLGRFLSREPCSSNGHPFIR